MGTYGFVRFSLPFFPAVVSHPKVQGWVIGLSLVGIVYGALVSLMQKDMKKLVAYSSVSHLGFCTLGIFALNSAGLTGSVLQQINHGISTGALFLIVGILYERRHTREIAEYGGISNVMPVYATITMIMFLSSMGLPLLNGFVGEFTILQGAFHRQLEVGGVGGAGRGSGRGVFALALSARFLRDGDQSQERKAARSYAARNSYLCAADHHGVVDRALSQAVFPDPRTAGQSDRADDS
jgi:NADH:ubiquinone oxidoreductase subunit 4 (subunit M)